LSTSLTEFWGVRWNPIIGKLLQEAFYKPFRRIGNIVVSNSEFNLFCTQKFTCKLTTLKACLGHSVCLFALQEALCCIPFLSLSAPAIQLIS
jgi:hypothetical protein